MTRGGRNLAILGVGAFLITTVTTGISLAIYHNSGDIYLDRSRPGYLPDEDEITEETDASTSYSFSENAEPTVETLEEYLEELKAIRDRLQDSSDLYSPAPLSDESLGISSELKEQ